MAEFPALPLFTDALLGDTMHLTRGQFGSYMLLLIIAWRTKDCALPNDDDFLSRSARMDRRSWALEKHKIMSFWKLDDKNKYQQGRLSDERHFVVQLSNKNSRASRARWLKNKETGHASAMPEACIRNPPTPTLIVSKKEEEERRKKESPPPLTGSAEKNFTDFWEVYPRKVGKTDATKLFETAIKKTPPETIIAGALRYADERRNQDPAYTAHPATWLRAGRWADEPGPTGAQTRAASHGKTAYGDSIALAAEAALAHLENR